MAAGQPADTPLDLAEEATGQLLGINIKAQLSIEDSNVLGYHVDEEGNTVDPNVYANTLLAMRGVYVLVRIEDTLDEEGCKIEGQLTYVPLLGPEVDEEGNVVLDEEGIPKDSSFAVTAPVA